VRQNDTVVKKLEYSQLGVKEYFILDEYKKNTAFYRLTSDGQYETIPEKNGVIESKVLPGFRFRVEDLYNQPKLWSLINDEVYSHYVMIYYQTALKQTQDAQKQAQDAQKQAQDAQKREAEAQKQAQDAQKREAEALQLVEKLKLQLEKLAH